jgi:hypothetical protein
MEMAANREETRFLKYMYMQIALCMAILAAFDFEALPLPKCPKGKYLHY